LPDGREFEAKLIGAESASDLVALKPDTDKPLACGSVGNSDDLTIGINAAIFQKGSRQSASPFQ
jgi:S1-C subfamily serine protease